MVSERRRCALFFAVVTAAYLVLSPWAIFGMGYTEENVNASLQILANLTSWLGLGHDASPIMWPRHGLFELLFEMPFLLVSRVLFGPSRVWLDRTLSLQPILLTASLCTVIFVWTRRVTGSQVWGLLLGLVAAFSTMLWPYAYIGLETTQSLFLLLSGYLALGAAGETTKRRTLVFVLCCSLAVSMKSNGASLAPAILFLLVTHFRPVKNGWVRCLAAVLIVAAVYAASAYTRGLSHVWAGGTFGVFQEVGLGGLIPKALNAVSLFSSPNKGLLVYAPVSILCLASLSKAFRSDRRTVVFACLALGGLVVGCSLVYFWADETWGPRYLHSAIGPLIICLAAGRKNEPFRWKKEVPLIGLTATGLIISFLGSLFYYGTMHQAEVQAGPGTLEALQHDPEWNHIRFNWMLLEIWRRRTTSQDAVLWPPPRRRWFPLPGESSVLEPPKKIDLRSFAMPQALILRKPSGPSPAPRITGSPADAPVAGQRTAFMGVFRPTTATFFLRRSLTAEFADLVISFGRPSDIPITGDWDGNGSTTVGVYRPDNSTFYLNNTNQNGEVSLVVPFGQRGDLPVVGDWDGNGTTTVGVFRPSNATFYLRNSNSAGMPELAIAFGIQGDVPIAGDWVGHGIVTIGVYRPSVSTFFLRDSNSSGGADHVVTFGTNGDLPLAGDWDGNGTATIGLYRPSLGLFILRNSNTVGESDISVSFGMRGDLPVTGHWR